MRFRKPGWWDKPNHPVFIVTAVVLIVFSVWFFWWMLAGRDDDGDSKVPNRAEWSQPATPTRPAAEPPKLPDAVFEPTEKGLEATVRYENDAINYAQRTRDVEPLKRVYDLERCAVCRGLIAEIEKGGENGRYLKGGAYTVVSISGEVVTPSDDGQYLGVIEIGIKRDAGRQLEPDGRLVQEIEASPPSVLELKLSFDNGEWRIYASQVKELGR